MRLLLVTDVWKPKIDGVIIRIGNVIEHLEKLGVTVQLVGPQHFRNHPIPGYAPARFVLPPVERALARHVDAFDPDAIHIITEGFLGIAARNLALRRGGRFTTSYTTQSPEYCKINFGIPLWFSYAIMRWFHRRSATVLSAKGDLIQRLEARGLRNLKATTMGVDTELFHPKKDGLFDNLEKPVCLFVGRVAREKNLPAFLSLDVPGTKVVVGEGPQRKELEAQFPDTLFLGQKLGEDLARCYASADLFVFPSRTDVLANVLREAAASGLPIAAFPVQGPKEFVIEGVTGAMSENLEEAIRLALPLSPVSCRREAEKLSWEKAAIDFAAAQVPFLPEKAQAFKRTLARLESLRDINAVESSCDGYRSPRRRREAF